MKKLVGLLLLLLVSQVAYAGEYCEYEEPTCLTCPSFIDTDTDTTRQDWGYGVGADVAVFKGTDLLEEIFVEGRYDIENRETRVFVVAKVDATKLWS